MCIVSVFTTMNGEIPSVPITTLAGVSSLTDCKYMQLYNAMYDVVQLIVHYINCRHFCN